MLSWEPYPQVELDNLAGAHSHLYHRVLISDGLQPATEPVPLLESFPAQNGLRAHVADCLRIYTILRRDAGKIRLNPHADTQPYVALDKN